MNIRFSFTSFKVILYLKFFKFGIAIQDFEGVYVAGTPLNAKSPHYPSNKTKAWSKARKPMSVLTYNGDHRVFFGKEINFNV